MWGSYKDLCRFLTDELVKDGKISKEEIDQFSEPFQFFLIGVAFLGFVVYISSPFIVSLLLLWFWGYSAVTISLVILSFAVSFDNARHFVQTIRDAYNDATKD